MFRLVFLAAFVIAVAVAAATARKAAARHGGTVNQLAHEARGLLIVRAALGLVFYAALAGWLFWPDVLTWMYLPVPTPARWTAVALLVPALAFFGWSFRALGSNYRGGVGLYDGHELVTTGPYRRLRHPIYAAFILIMLLVLLISANWVLGLSGLCLVISIALVRIPIEERELRERFGTAWTVHQGRTGSLLPRLGA